MAGVKGTDKYKLNLSIDHDLARRFAAFSAFTGEDQSAIVARLMRSELRGFVVARRKDAGQAEPAEVGPIRLAGAQGREAG